MRLLQLSVNPVLALRSMSNDKVAVDSAILDRVLEEGHSAKMLAVIDHAYSLARMRKKSVIWTIFTEYNSQFCFFSGGSESSFYPRRRAVRRAGESREAAKGVFDGSMKMTVV